jgi:glycosyltransferase involved in cell wall biosynthesis
MRIIHIAAGAGGMYCGACARDLALMRGLLARGHEVEIVPLYTPLRDEHGGGVPVAPIHYGGINVYLQQLSHAFARLPTGLARLIDHPRLLTWVSRFAISTRPEELGTMTVSVLAGADGRQRAELDRLLDYLAQGARPTLVSLTNSLLSGIAPALKARFDVPVFCALQGEENFIAAMPAHHREAAQTLMRRNAQAIDRFLAPSEANRLAMAEYLALPLERIALVRPGLDPTPFRAAVPAPAPFTVGYLSVITPSKGLDLLLSAFARLHARHPDARLLIAGKPLDPHYWDMCRRTLIASFPAESVEVLGEVNYEEKIALLQRCSVLAHPTRQPESRGMVALEAQAAGVPVVAPASGIFPEMLGLTGGGVLYPSGDAAGLADALIRLADEPAQARALGEAGAAGVAAHFSAEGMTAALLQVSGEVMTGRTVGI